jgi:hypothetical protein
VAAINADFNTSFAIYYRNVPKGLLYDNGINGTPLNFLYTDYKEAGPQVAPDRKTQLYKYKYSRH